MLPLKCSGKQSGLGLLLQWAYSSLEVDIRSTLDEHRPHIDVAIVSGNMQRREARLDEKIQEKQDEKADDSLSITRQGAFLSYDSEKRRQD